MNIFFQHWFGYIHCIFFPCKWTERPPIVVNSYTVLRRWHCRYCRSEYTLLQAKFGLSLDTQKKVVSSEHN